MVVYMTIFMADGKSQRLEIVLKWLGHVDLYARQNNQFRLLITKLCRNDLIQHGLCYGMHLLHQFRLFGVFVPHFIYGGFASFNFPTNKPELLVIVVFNSLSLTNTLIGTDCSTASRSGRLLTKTTVSA